MLVALVEVILVKVVWFLGYDWVLLGGLLLLLLLLLWLLWLMLLVVVLVVGV